MEVHQHSHTPRKKWTHYFWEFLMLFLAVFCGFLAENKREHVVEHQREKVYAINLYGELQQDTTRLSDVMKKQDSISLQLDTLCILLRNKNKDSITPGMLYYHGSRVPNVNYFSSRNTTLEQLKGSGNLRIMGHDLSYKISEYDRLIRELEKEYELSKTEFAKLEDVHFRVFDMFLMEELFPGTRRSPRDSIFPLLDLPINNNAELLREYVGWVKFEANIYRYQSRVFLSAIRDSATSILNTLKKEYRFE